MSEIAKNQALLVSLSSQDCRTDNQAALAAMNLVRLLFQAVGMMQVRTARAFHHINSRIDSFTSGSTLMLELAIVREEWGK
jgi:hypothetical protein